MQGRLHLVHRVEAPQSVLRAFDAYVNCSVFEGSSNAIIEAMASGVPVIATAVGGSPELVSDGESGLLVSPRAPTELAKAMVRISDHAFAERLGAAGRARAEAKHELDSMCRAYGELYDELVRSPPRSRAQAGLRMAGRLLSR